MKNKSLKNSKLSQKILFSILAAGVLGMSGNVFANDLEIVDQTITDRDYGKYITATSSYGNITGNSVVYAPTGGLAGGAAYISSYVSGSQVIVPEVTFNNSLVANNKAEATAGATYGSSAGGALFIKGSTAIFNDAVFTNNIAEAKGAFYAVGGAILADAKVNTGIKQQTSIRFNNTKDTVYTGNNVISADSDNRWYDTYGGLTTTAGGFLFLDRSADATFNVTNGSTLTIGEANSENNMDTIASSLIHSPNVKTATIKKTGNGTLTINSDFNKYYGTITVEEGTVNLNKDLTVKNTFTVNSQGTLNLGNVTLDRLSNAVGGTNVNKEAGTFNLVGVNASNAGKTETYTLSDSVGSITTAAGSTLNAGNVVLKDGTSIIAAGEVNISKGLTLEGNDAKAKLNGGGSIDGFVRIDGGEVTMTGVKITTGDVYEKEEGLYLQEDIRVNGSENGDQSVSSKLTLDGVEVIGNIMAEHKGSEISITNSTINEGEFYQADKENGRYQLVLDENGQPIVEGYTELQAEIGGKVTVKNSVLNTSLSAYGEGSEMTVTNSSVKTKGGVLAAEGGKIYLNGNADTVYEVAKDGYFMAASTNQDDTDTKIEINGGTLKAENLRYLVGVGTDENGNTNPCLDESYDGEEQKFYTVKGGIVLQKNGVIETKGDQIFEKGVDVSSDENVLASVSGKVTNNAISYVGGTLNLTDEKYSLGYVQSAKDSLHGLTYGDNVNSTTGIVMSGTLISELGENQLDVDNASSVGDEVALDKVTVNADKNLIVGVKTDNKVTVDGIEIEDSVNNGFSAGALNLADDSTCMIITDGQNVTLGGSNGGSVDGKQLVTVAGAVPSGDGVSVVVGLGANDRVEGVSKNAGSFTIGNALATSDTAYTLTGKVTVNANSELNVNGATTITGGVTLANGALNVGNGVLTSDIKADGNVSITGSAVVGTLSSGEEVKTNDNTTVINIGSADKAGNVTVATADLNGATVFLDPAWKDGAEITDASKMAVAGTEGKVALNGNYVVGRNSVMSFGVGNNEKAQETFAKTGLTWGEKAITAGLYINGSVNLNGQAIVVDGNLKKADEAETKAGTFTAADNSVVMVDGTAITGTNDAAIAEATTVTVKETSKLYIDGAKKGETYHVIAGVDTDGWADANIVSDNALLVFNGDDNTGDKKFDVTAKYQSVNNVYGDNAVVIDNIVDKTLADKDAGDKAFDFFNDAVNYKNNATKAAQVEALNSVANMGELAGVNHGTYSMSNAMTDAVAHHLSLATHGEQDKDIWAHYIHNKEDIDGMDFGGVDGSYEAQYNGIVVGSDLYKNGKTTAGIALSYADGNINGSNIASSTKNEAEYYGASLYGRIDNGNSAILGDISYMHSDNDITQNNSGHEITASADADAFSIGIRAEQAYKAGAGKFVPYAGIRYMHLGAGDYSNSLGMEYNADDQNLWLLPVGVTYSAEVQSGDWTVKPIAEVGYVWTMGDRDTDQTVSLNGASDTFGFETADSGSFIGRLGIEAEKADVTYGLSYEYQKGDTVKANKWMANLTWSF